MGKKEYIVIGLGQFGMSIAQTLMQNDCEVLVLDINEKRTRAIADSVTCAVTGNVMDAELLAGLGIRNFDGAVIAIGENMEASIMATMVVNELGVPHILAKAQSELHAKILRKVGAVELSPDISMMEINVRREWEGKSLKQLNMRAKYKINVIGIKSEDGFDVNPDPDEPLNANSKLVSIGRNEVLNKLAEGLI